jgi:MEMO1 family protein
MKIGSLLSRALFQVEPTSSVRGGPVMRVRPPVFAGRFYPAHPDPLREQVRDFLAGSTPAESRRPRALIVPHAGYAFSGPVAASGYAWLTSHADSIDRVVLLGTCHTQGIVGLAAASVEAFQTPLGTVPIDRAAVAEALRLNQVQIDQEAHDRDHALEVQLPFLQVILSSFTIVPFLVGRADAASVAEVLEGPFRDDERTLCVVSSDLSHHQPHEEARRLDTATASAIERLDGESLGPRSACGRHAIAGLLHAARRHGLSCRTVDLRSSGDTAGPRDRVVGYGAWVFLPPGGEHNSPVDEEPGELGPLE